MPKDATTDVAQFLMFRCGTVCAGLRLEDLRETLRPLPVVVMQAAPSFVRGLAIIRGLPTVVVDGCRLLSHDDPGERPAQSQSRFISLRVPERPVALAVDAVLGIRQFAAGALASLPPLVSGLADGPIEHLARLDGDVWMLLRAGRLISKMGEVLVNGGAETHA